MKKNGIYDGLLKIISRNYTSFHVPGHKERFLEKYYKNFLKMDTTEILGSDNLHSASGIIKNSQDKAKEFYESKESFFLVNGTTSGILTMISASLDQGDKVLIGRDSHKSVLNACILNKLNVFYYRNIFDKKTFQNIGPNIEDILSQVSKNSDIKAILLTYPTYNGVCYDIEKLMYELKNKELIILVDEAHGAHLKLSENLPKSLLDLGADIVVQSTHKMLTSFTQSSMIHFNTNKVSLEKFKYYLTVFQSSSPSYLLMSSLDIALNIAINDGEKLVNDYFENYLEFKNKISSLKYIYLQNEYLEKNCFVNMDFFKINLSVKNDILSGFELDRIFREKYSIICEYSSFRYVLLVCSIFTLKEDLNKLYDAVLEIDMELEDTNRFKNDICKLEEFINFDIPNKKFEIYERYDEEKVRFSKRVIGRVSTRSIVPYPPGIPLLLPGEIIDEKIFLFISKLIESKYEIEGILEKEYIFLKTI